MKKTFITEEYSSEATPGTINMKELRNFFSSKILKLDTIITIDNNDVIWTEASDNTQGLGVDNVNQVLNTSTLKSDNHTVVIYPNQSATDKLEFTTWLFTFNIRDMISQYIFAQLKKSGVFSGISNENTKNNSINSAILDYITYNIFPRISFSTINFYVKYYPISEPEDDGTIALMYDVRFRDDLIKPSPLPNETTAEYNTRQAQYEQSLQTTNFQLTTDAPQNTATLLYKQIYSSTSYKFDYYFDIVYQKSKITN